MRTLRLCGENLSLAGFAAIKARTYAAAAHQRMAVSPMDKAICTAMTDDTTEAHPLAAHAYALCRGWFNKNRMPKGKGMPSSMPIGKSPATAIKKLKGLGSRMMRCRT